MDEIPIIKINEEDDNTVFVMKSIPKKQNKFQKAFFTIEVFLVLFFLYEELLFHFVRFFAQGDDFVYKLLFSILFGSINASVILVFPEKVARILVYISTGIVCVLFAVQIIYSGVFRTYLSVSGSVGMTGQAFDFTDVIWKEVSSEWWVILLTFAPLVAYCVYLRRLFLVKRSNLVRTGINFASVILLFVVCLIAIKNDKDDIYTAYEVYEKYPSVDMAVAKLGVHEALWLDIKAGVNEKLGLKKEEVSFVVENANENTQNGTSNVGETNSGATQMGQLGIEELKDLNVGSGITLAKELGWVKVIDTSPNILDIDFETLIAEEKDTNIKNLHTYISSVTPTNKNEYTGMFEGYNLIFVVAEGFSGFVIDKERTPLLYNMSTQGFHFNHYYTPLWYGSTVGGEYADLTGMMPKNGSYLSMNKIGRNKNDMMFTLANQLNAKGYTCYGFHNNDYTYYDRNYSHPVLGYEWIGMGNGLQYEKENGTSLWPQSDLSLVQNTFDMYKDKEPFHTYYLTVSGHVMYNFGGNSMAKRHQDLVLDLAYSDTTKAYIACQYELELAMEALVADLEMEGIDDHTLIVLTADHVPYDNKEVVDELAGRTLDNTFGWYQNTLIIWSPSMEKKVEVDKYCCSLDVLPTVSNLMGLPYDSRMMVGQDIMSDSEGLVIFNDHSFITDTCYYNANTGESRNHDGTDADKDYIDAKINQVKNKFSMAESICNYNYYKYIRTALEK